MRNISKYSNDWPNEIIKEICGGKRYRSGFKKCIELMRNKKLYKYYSFLSDYTLQNIEDDLIYLSNPTAFNDPFDCNIGVSANSLIRALIPNFLSVKGIELDEKSLKLLNCIIFDDSKEEITDASQERILTELTEIPAFCDLIKCKENGNEISDQQLFEVFVNAPELLTKLISAVFSKEFQDISEMNREKLLEYVVRSPSAIKNLISMTKSANETEGQILDIMSRDDDFLRKISEIANLMGQPIDENSIKQVYDSFESATKQMHTEIGKTFGVSCFTERPDNMLMWAHYADKHTGICVEYNFGKLFSGSPSSLLFPVNYTKCRPIIPLEKIIDFTEGNMTVNKENLNLILSDIMESLIAKSDIWQYEKEWRLIQNIKNEGDRKIRLPLISGIYCGINISDENLQKITELAEKKSIPLYRYSLKCDRYEVQIKS